MRVSADQRVQSANELLPGKLDCDPGRRRVDARSGETLCQPGVASIVIKNEAAVGDASDQGQRQGEETKAQFRWYSANQVNDTPSPVRETPGG
jgi:hypothetical protein